jgi:hypothetical protein
MYSCGNNCYLRRPNFFILIGICFEVIKVRECCGHLRKSSRILEGDKQFLESSMVMQSRIYQEASRKGNTLTTLYIRHQDCLSESVMKLSLMMVVHSFGSRPILKASSIPPVVKKSLVTMQNC